MEFRGRLPEEGINVSRTHPLREALHLSAGLILVGAVIVMLGAVLVDRIVPHIPTHWETTLFGSYGSSVAADAENGEEDAVLRASLQALVARLASHWPETPYRFRVIIVDQPEPNALAFPGGLIGVTSGLLEKVESENELAFVLGHELGHFHNRDHLRSLGRGLVLSLVLASATEGSTGNLVSLAPALAERSFARDQEREADRFGLELVYREYGHVAAAGDFFTRIHLPGTALERELVGYLSTHPVSSERIGALRVLGREQGWPDSGELRPFSR